jgi:protein-S-isoprenylcysteine O-methyltransferase Ste14
LIFTLLVPVVLGGLVPSWIGGGDQNHVWSAVGWLPMLAGTTIYVVCLLRFLGAGGTPAIFFTRPLRSLIGEEPARLVEGGMYRLSRNPMYIGVLLAVFGQAILCASLRIAGYGLALCAFFQFVVVFLEEPHLRRERGPAYAAYYRRVPRWF